MRRCAATSPGFYLKVLALLIPRQDKLEHTNTIKTMTDEELEGAIAFLHEMMAAFYVCGECWSFDTAKTQLGHRRRWQYFMIF